MKTATDRPSVSKLDRENYIKGYDHAIAVLEQETKHEICILAARFLKVNRPKP